jgi:hypothetical protein
MKKVLVLLVAALLLMTPVFANVAGAADAGAAALLSRTMAGTGEWYNNGFRGSFPWGECIVGYICCLVTGSSMFDAAAGKTNTEMRLDFWTPPR